MRIVLGQTDRFSSIQGQFSLITNQFSFFSRIEPTEWEVRFGSQRLTEVCAGRNSSAGLPVVASWTRGQQMDRHRRRRNERCCVFVNNWPGSRRQRRAKQRRSNCLCFENLRTGCESRGTVQYALPFGPNRQ